MSPSSIQLVDVSPRDGLQNEKVLLSTADKLDLIRRLVARGATRIEVTGFARPDVVPALADADEVARAAAAIPGIEASALVLNGRSYDRALDTGVRAVNMVVLATETFSGRNQGMSVDRAIEVTAGMRERAASDGLRFSVTVGASFGCPFEGDVSLERLSQVLTSVVALAPDEIALADTIGVGTPLDVTERFGLLRSLAPATPMRIHLHDTRNTGVANAVAAVAAGVAALDASLAGIGGCPFAPAATGNVATEDLVYCFERMGVATGLDLDGLLEESRWLSSTLDKPRSALARAGSFGTLAAAAGR
jgi:hydroxymethylglutaryl-CoA lyase